MNFYFVKDLDSDKWLCFDKQAKSLVWLTWDEAREQSEKAASFGETVIPQLKQKSPGNLKLVLDKDRKTPNAFPQDEYKSSSKENLDFSRYGDREEIIVRWPDGGEAPIEGGRTREETDKIIQAMNDSYQRQGMPQRAHRKGGTQTKPQQIETQPAEQQQGFDVMGKIGQATGQAANILTRPWQKAIAPYIAVLYVFLFIGVFFVALWNIGPYEVAVRFIASRFGTSALVPFLLTLPVIGWLLSGIGYLIFWIVGAVVWAIIQLIELLPIIMTYNPGYVRNVLQEQEAHESLRPDKNDPGVVRYLKKFYNQFPMRFLVIARRLRVWVYVLDMLIVMMVYPPVREGGIGRFFFLLATGQWGQFDWVNIILMFVTLFAMEAVVKLLLTVKHFRDYLKQTKRQPQAA